MNGQLALPDLAQGTAGAPTAVLQGPGDPDDAPQAIAHATGGLVCSRCGRGWPIRPGERCGYCGRRRSAHDGNGEQA